MDQFFAVGGARYDVANPGIAQAERSWTVHTHPVHNDLWLRLDCRICRPRKRSETTTATLLASDARSARLMDDITIFTLPELQFVTELLDHFLRRLTRRS